MSSIKDVAKMAGVSTATVSRVLNDDKTYKMTDATRLKVREAASTLAYTLGKADPAVKPKIGCVLSVTKDKYSDPYFMSILSGIEEQLAAEGLSLTFLRTFFELEDDAVLADTFAGGITGVILMGIAQEPHVRVHPPEIRPCCRHRYAARGHRQYRVRLFPCGDPESPST